jgi:hypothetical protein
MRIIIFTILAATVMAVCMAQSNSSNNSVKTVSYPGDTMGRGSTTGVGDTIGQGSSTGVGDTMGSGSNAGVGDTIGGGSNPVVAQSAGIEDTSYAPPVQSSVAAGASGSAEVQSPSVDSVVDPSSEPNSSLSNTGSSSDPNNAQ